MSAIDCGEEAAKWMSEFILGKDTGVRLGLHDGEYKRTPSKAITDFLKAYRKTFHKKYMVKTLILVLEDLQKLPFLLKILGNVF